MAHLGPVFSRVVVQNIGPQKEHLVSNDNLDSVEKSLIICASGSGVSYRLPAKSKG